LRLIKTKDVFHFSNIISDNTVCLDYAGKACQGKNTLAYYENVYVMDKKSFITFASGGVANKPFFSSSQTLTQNSLPRQP
jgi:hypothetical protein